MRGAGGRPPGLPGVDAGPVATPERRAPAGAGEERGSELAARRALPSTARSRRLDRRGRLGAPAGADGRAGRARQPAGTGAGAARGGPPAGGTRARAQAQGSAAGGARHGAGASPATGRARGAENLAARAEPGGRDLGAFLSSASAAQGGP